MSSKLVKNGKEEPEVEMPAKEAVKEHKRLVNVLESESHEDDAKEAKKQKKELKEYKKEMKKGNIMDENTLEEIDKLAKSLSDDDTTKREDLFETIKTVGREEMKKALEIMSLEEKQLIKSVLEGNQEIKEISPPIDKRDSIQTKEEIKKSSEDIMEEKTNEETVEKAVKMDAVAHPEADAMSEKVMVGKVDTKKEQDEEDEKMVSTKKEAAEVRHQGGSGEDGAWQGQVIKSEQKEFIKETLVLAKSIGISKEKLKEAIILSKGNMALVRAILEKSKEGATSKMDEECKKEAKKKEAASGSPEETADEMKAKVPSKVKKSVFWGSENELLKSSTKRGQNAHYEVQDALIKSEEEQSKRLSETTFNYDHEEGIEKSRGKTTINEMIEKGMDITECDAISKSRKQDPSGAYTVTSFDVMQIARDMNISEKEANELLGLKKSGEMEPIYDDKDVSDAKDVKAEVDGEKLEKEPKKKKIKEKKMPDVK